MNTQLSILSAVELDERIVNTKELLFESLIEMRADKKYKELGFDTWEQYLDARGFTVSKWKKMLSYNRVLDNIDGSNSNHFINEGQAMELAPLETEQQVEVWEKVTENGKPVTAKAIRETKIELYDTETIVEIEEVESILDIKSFEDTGDNTIEVYQLCLKQTAEIKTYSKYKEWLNNLIKFLISKHKYNEE